MNDQTELYWMYSKKTNDWIDATDLIASISNTGNSFKVRFRSFDGVYYKSYRDLIVLRDPLPIKAAKYTYCGRELFHVKKALAFGSLVKIFFENGKTLTGYAADFEFIRNALASSSQSKGIMGYYQSILEEESKTEEMSFLRDQFANLDWVSDKSVLALYLSGKTGNSEPFLSYPVIAPFGINASQKTAISQALKNRISIIQGPPGTGKTQTILNIIANLLIKGKTVAVTSNNNAATDNVLEKLKQYELDYLAAPLGSVDNVERFFAEYDSTVPVYAKQSYSRPFLDDFFSHAEQYFNTEIKKKQAQQQLSDLKLEHEHFLFDHKGFSFRSINPPKPEKIMAALVYFGEPNRKRLHWLRKLLLKRRFGLPYSFFALKEDEKQINLQNLYYLAKKKEILGRIALLSDILHGRSFEENLKKYTAMSMTYLKNYLSEHLPPREERFGKDDYRRDFNAFTKAFPIVLSSTHSLVRCSKKGFLFDYLIVDEASQANMASAILSMSVAKNVIVVGDSKQLPQIDAAGLMEINDSLLEKYGVRRAYSYLGQSLLSSMIALYGSKVPQTLLREHYRCDPGIIGFCNEEFYDDKLIIVTPPKNSPSMHLIRTVPGNFARRNPDGSGIYNQREIDEIVDLLGRVPMSDVGIIAPYRYQADLLSAALPGVECSTVHKFQGREKDYIIFSATVNDANEFVDDPNLINVAVSRAKKDFYLISSDKVAKSNSGILADLVHYIRFHSEYGSEEEGRIHGIYDLLYEDYHRQLRSFMINAKNGEYPSEVVTEIALRKVLQDEKYRNLRFAMHVSLRDFVRKESVKLTEVEAVFFNNPLAHADFLVYRRFDRKPILAIEVDGIAYHEQSPIQLERDQIKDAILRKAGIRLLRLKTNQSRETERMTAALDAALADTSEIAENE